MTTKRGNLPGGVKAPAEKLVQGRPRKLVPLDAAEVIRQACAVGASKQGVAMALGCSIRALDRWMDEDEALKEAFAEGREKERQTLHSALQDAAKAGNMVAAMFLLKARHGYVEGQQQDQANRVSITFNIPAAQPLNQFMVIDDAKS